MSNLYSVLCTLLSHDWEYTDEYANEYGHVQADKICLRCGSVKHGWTGPTVDEIEEYTDYDVPTKEQAYKDVIQ